MGSVKIKIEELRILFEFLEDNLKDLQRIKLAVISLKPDGVVIPTIAQNEFPKFNIRPFSTIGATKHWILH